ncbi:hypothetical protein [Streptomyces sp. MNU89]|uniref:hypothetical protein n=1 Tax=Streptomyces sp. MNU89 TaxID=2560025 RepID=UPI001E33DCD5|nr:hypothetical protein [Streptomyces sp. MNU89]MCC9740315.1 hypothetical protein [Streptomyces sp. MNU89]
MSGCAATNLPDPVYWVTPRHPAGDDGVRAERIDDTLSDLDWRMWPTFIEDADRVPPWWAGRRGRTLFPAPRTCGVPASAPASPFATIARSNFPLMIEELFHPCPVGAESHWVAESTPLRPPVHPIRGQEIVGSSPNLRP